MAAGDAPPGLLEVGGVVPEMYADIAAAGDAPAGLLEVGGIVPVNRRTIGSWRTEQIPGALLRRFSA